MKPCDYFFNGCRHPKREQVGYCLYPEDCPCLPDMGGQVMVKMRYEFGEQLSGFLPVSRFITQHAEEIGPNSMQVLRDGGTVRVREQAFVLVKGDK